MIPVMSSTAPDLTIVIVSWNVRQLLLSCLDSIFADATAPALQVIVVDNASTDGTVAAVSQRFPRVETIANRENIGFPRANNQGLARARGRHVLFLNPDTVVNTGTLAACVAELERDPALGAVGCMLQFPDGTVQYEGARVTHRFRHLLYELAYLHVLFPRSRIFGEHLLGHWDHRGTRDVEALSGAFMMVPRHVAVELGGLPEDLFMYHEDLSFCLRILRSGRRIRYLGDVSVVHYGAQSARRSTVPLGLLSVEAKVQCIREADGDTWAVAARLAIGVRGVIRLGICLVGILAPQRWKRRYPRVFDWRMHLAEVVWSVAPPLARRWQLDRSFHVGRAHHVHAVGGL